MNEITENLGKRGVGLDNNKLAPANELAARNPIHHPGESVDYRAARQRLLAREYELRRLTESVAAERRALPPGAEVTRAYRFVGEVGEVTLSDLFGGHDALFAYSYMFGPKRKAPCPMCAGFMNALASIEMRVPARSSRSAHANDVKCDPWSVFMMPGAPNRWIAAFSDSTQTSAARGVRDAPGKHFPGAPVHAGDQIKQAPLHRDISDVSAPDLIGPRDQQTAQQVWIGLVALRRPAGVGRLIDRHQPHEAHQPTGAILGHGVALVAQVPGHLPHAIERRVEELLAQPEPDDYRPMSLSL